MRQHRSGRRVTVLLAALVALTFGAGVLVAIAPPGGDSRAADAGESLPDVTTPEPAPSFSPWRLPPLPTASAQPQVARARPAACPQPARVSSAPTTAAWGTYASTPVYERPGGRLKLTLKNPTRDHQQLVLLVKEQAGDWLRVQYSERPNGSHGWIPANYVEQRQVTTRVVVEKCARRVTVYERGRPVLQETVAIGKPATPTPVVESYVDFVYHFTKSGSYGPYLVSVASFSEVLMRFGKDGVGQLAIHGTNARWSVGRAASNGCLRMYNEAVTRLAQVVQVGSPVSITP